MALRSIRTAHLDAQKARAAATTLPIETAKRAALILAITTLTAFAALLWSLGHARANSGTVEEQMACTPDVFRLCSAQIPSEERIVACLNDNLRKLSPACRRVMDGDDEPPAKGNKRRS